MITVLLYVLFSQAAFDFPIHTLPLPHSLALASQLTLYTLCTLCTPFASVLSGISTNTLSNVSLPFSRSSEQVSQNARGQGHAGPFHENCPLKKTQRYIDDERYFVYGSADTLGLLAPILHKFIKRNYKNYNSDREYVS